MAINSINLNLTTQGITALNNILANASIFSITKVELSQNLIPNVDPNVWQPDGGIGSPYYIQNTNIVLLSAGADDTFIMDMQLDETIPLPVLEGGGNPNGWSASPQTYINIGSFAIFITNPVTSEVVPFLLGYFNATTIQKYSNTITMPGNFIDIFNNMELAPFSTDAIVYNLTQIVNAQVAYLNHIYNLPIPQNDISNAFILDDVKVIAYTDYKKWFFTNYSPYASNVAMTAISGSSFTSAALYSALPSAYHNSDNVFSNYAMLGEICGADGIMKKSFAILSNTGTSFNTNVTLPALVAGDTITAFVTGSDVGDTYAGLIPTGQNLNTYTLPGQFVQPLNASAGTNYPLYNGNTYAGVLTVSANDSSVMVWQTYIMQNVGGGTATFVRCFSASVWGAWMQVAYVSNVGYGIPPVVTDVPSTVTLGATDTFAKYTASGVAITLPALATVVAGILFTIKNGNYSGNTLKANGSENIDGSASTIIVAPYETYQVRASIGLTEWEII